MTAKKGKYAEDQLFHAKSCDNDPNTVNVMSSHYNKV